MKRTIEKIKELSNKEGKDGWRIYKRKNYNKAIQIIDNQPAEFFKKYDIINDDITAAIQILKK